MSLWTRRNVHDASKKCSFILDASRINEHIFGSVRNTVRLDKTRQLHKLLKDYLPYYTRTSLKDIIEVHCKQILCKIMKIALLGNI